MKKVLTLIFALCLFAALSPDVKAQFREEAFTQNYAEDGAAQDTTQRKNISVQNLFRSLAGKEEMKVGSMFMGSLLLPGTAQIYYKEYWKLPVYYTAIGTTLGLGIYYNNRNRTAANWLFAGAIASYWALQLDSVLSFDKGHNPLPGRATLLSVLFPGAGQIYNGEYWKVPIYQGGIALCVHFVITNQGNYTRYRNIYIDSMEPGYNGPIASDVALYYRNTYRRLRDYSVLATVAVYLLQIIDANVFSFMGNFEMGDDITLKMEPSVIPMNEDFAFSSKNNAFGLSMKLRF